MKSLMYTVISTNALTTLKLQRIYNCGYVIMPNHLLMLVYMANTEKTINKIIGESKRFLLNGVQPVSIQ